MGDLKELYKWKVDGGCDLICYGWYDGRLVLKISMIYHLLE